MKAEDVISIYNLLQENAIEVWIDGGWGVDALLGARTGERGLGDGPERDCTYLLKMT